MVLTTVKTRNFNSFFHRVTVFIFQNNFGLLSLEISNVRADDAGIYTVRIANREGEAVCNASLEVDGEIPVTI